jgi:transposase InsO family protein
MTPMYHMYKDKYMEKFKRVMRHIKFISMNRRLRVNGLYCPAKRGHSTILLYKGKEVPFYNHKWDPGAVRIRIGCNHGYIYFSVVLLLLHGIAFNRAISFISSIKKQSFLDALRIARSWSGCSPCTP